MCGIGMNNPLIKAVENNYRQLKKDGYIPDDNPFYMAVVDMSYISDECRYYSGLIFVSNICQHPFKKGLLNTSADAARCQGVGPQISVLFSIVHILC